MTKYRIAGIFAKLKLAEEKNWQMDGLSHKDINHKMILVWGIMDNLTNLPNIPTIWYAKINQVSTQKLPHFVPDATVYKIKDFNKKLPVADACLVHNMITVCFQKVTLRALVDLLANSYAKLTWKGFPLFAHLSPLPLRHQPHKK